MPFSGTSHTHMLLLHFSFSLTLHCFLHLKIAYSTQVLCAQRLVLTSEFHASVSKASPSTFGFPETFAMQHDESFPATQSNLRAWDNTILLLDGVSWPGCSGGKHLGGLLLHSNCFNGDKFFFRENTTLHVRTIICCWFNEKGLVYVSIYVCILEYVFRVITVRQTIGLFTIPYIHISYLIQIIITGNPW